MNHYGSRKPTLPSIIEVQHTHTVKCRNDKSVLKTYNFLPEKSCITLKDNTHNSWLGPQKRKIVMVCSKLKTMAIPVKAVNSTLKPGHCHTEGY